MPEMNKTTSDNYFRIFENDLADGGFFYFLNKEAVDKDAVQNPTGHPFPSNWKLKSMAPTLMGFVDDFRHIELLFTKDVNFSTHAVLRNNILDFVYSLFLNRIQARYFSCV